MQCTKCFFGYVSIVTFRCNECGHYYEEFEPVQEDDEKKGSAERQKD